MLLRKLTRHFSSTPNLSELPCLPKISSKQRAKALQEAREALTEYLHSTKSVPFTYAEHITRHSPSSLRSLVSSLDYSPGDFSRTVRRHLRYHPINEFEFFFESIGVNPEEIKSFLPANKFFLSEDDCCLNAAYALSGFGFSWNKLGALYREQVSIFSKTPKELMARLSGFKNRGFSSTMVIGICSTFPQVLIWEDHESDALFNDFNRILDCDMISSVDDWSEVCRKIGLLYELGFEKGKLGNLMGRCKNLLLECREEVFVEKVMYFRKFGFSNQDIGWLILQRPELLSLDLETPVISVIGLLKHFGMSSEELKPLSSMYPYVLGRNRMANLPHVIRALNLQRWFLSQMKDSNRGCLASYVINDNSEDSDEVYRKSLEEINSSRYYLHQINKLRFLHGIGFGENALTIQVLNRMHGTSSELQERFDCLLSLGIDFCRLCKIVSFCPKVLNQQPKTLEQKVDFLLNEMGSSLDKLYDFPTFLCYDLEYRIRPRFSCHKWLVEKSLSTRSYSLPSIVATSEKNFIARLYNIHPAIPKIWFELFSCKRN